MADLKMALSDRAIAQLPPPDGKRYTVRDTDLKGFQLVVGARRKTFVVQGEYWEDGKRAGKTVSIGHAGDMSVRDARVKAKALLAKIASGELIREDEAVAAEQAKPEEPPKPIGVTLRQAWARYKTVLERKERSPATIEGYEKHVERLLTDWLDTPLQELGEDPSKVSERHDYITENHGPSAANGTMRTLRAIYNHARKSHRSLPPENPTLAVDWNLEKRRDTAMGVDDLPGWFEEARLMRHQVRREFHLFILLSGSRPGAILQARLADLNLRDRILHVPRPKGGANKAFDIPLSRPMILCLIRAIRAGRALLPEQAKTWIFVGDSESGHMTHHKEDRETLSKWGNDLRQTYRTLGQEAELSEVDMHLLMNHSLPGVNAGYITRAKLMNTHLRQAQAKLSKLILGKSKITAPKWPLIPSRKIGDSIVDPTLPDPRSLAYRMMAA